jgi:hypothetical protein
MTAAPSKTDVDLERLRAAWEAATPEAKRIFAEVHFAMDGGQPLKVFGSVMHFHGAKWSRR